MTAILSAIAGLATIVTAGLYLVKRFAPPKADEQKKEDIAVTVGKAEQNTISTGRP